MAVTGTARIPSLPPNALASVAAHVQTHHAAKNVGPWRMRFRPYRMVRSPDAVKGMRAGEGGGGAWTQRRTMWTVSDNAYPDAAIVLFEDPSLPTRNELQTLLPDAAPPHHTRWHSHAVSASFASLLHQANLPGPLGAPAGTTGPGAWVQRGATVGVDGVTLHIRLSQREASAALVAGLAVDAQDECVLRIGNLLVGSDRVVGGIVEAALGVFLG
ncbi:hypothetical protein MSPP1_001184 [Malassezia sp. CBS 17886]|nr:hypothetical protein MSPP1_001184 [Malassezia sp. CBS 17886]